MVQDLGLIEYLRRVFLQDQLPCLRSRENYTVRGRDNIAFEGQIVVPYSLGEDSVNRSSIQGSLKYVTHGRLVSRLISRPSR